MPELGPREALLRWFDAERRDLPWRGIEDPYGIWVSEVMLQQTRVDTVRDYWIRWMQRFPTVAHLARAHEDEVIRMWSGLGYYRRARHLHLAARTVAERGEFPRSASEWRELPGIGPYAAAAISSIAHGEPVAAIDGNAIRVLSRLFALPVSGESAADRRLLRSCADELLSPQRPGDSNEAIMELGAVVCTPRRPSCHACPVRTHCAAASDGLVDELPLPKRRATPREARSLTFVLAHPESPARLLVSRRPHDSGLLAGTWEFPTVEIGHTAAFGALRDQFSIEVLQGQPCGDFVHVFSHIRMTYSVTSGVAIVHGPAPRDTRWVDATALAGLGFSKAMRRAGALAGVAL